MSVVVLMWELVREDLLPSPKFEPLAERPLRLLVSFVSAESTTHNRRDLNQAFGKHLNNLFCGLCDDN